MIKDELTKALAEAYTRMLTENSGMEAAAAAVHKAWMGRNPKGDWNAAQHVDYADLPEEEKEKDRAHLHTVGKLMADNPRQEGEKEEDHHERVANMFGSMAHEDWRKGHEAKSGKGATRMKKVSDGGEVDINVGWDKLHPEWKKENLEAGRAAVAAHREHMSK